jgi:hypothetical protein
MKKLILMLVTLFATPAMAEGFNLTQLIQYDFELKAAVALPGRAAGSATEVLYLQGKLPGGIYEVIMRCTARPDPEEGSSNCEQVY